MILFSKVFKSMQSQHCQAICLFLIIVIVILIVNAVSVWRVYFIRFHYYIFFYSDLTLYWSDWTVRQITVFYVCYK